MGSIAGGTTSALQNTRLRTGEPKRGQTVRVAKRWAVVVKSKQPVLGGPDTWPEPPGSITLGIFAQRPEKLYSRGKAR